MEEKKIAVLIDGDNTSPEYVNIIMAEANKAGVITYKRIYGDWTTNRLNSWKDILLEYSISPIQQYAYTQGKNATDTAMVIDAMDILYTGNVDGFCIVSSDSDFTRLAARLREAGMRVIGMGKQQTPKPFISACSMFKYLDLIGMENQSEGNLAITKEGNRGNTVPNKIENAISKMVDEDSDANGWLLASTIGTRLAKQYNDFDYRNYGYRKMIDFLKAIGYEIKVASDKTTYKIRKQ